MTMCWLVVNTLWGVGLQVLAEAVALGSTPDLPRDLLFDTLAKTAARRSIIIILSGTTRARERWVSSVRRECLSKLIFFGEASLRRALTEYRSAPI
jgi:hypothetical protein